MRPRATNVQAGKADLFPIGEFCVTEGIRNNVEILAALPGLLQRHKAGDWGALCAFDRQQNADALQYGGRLVSEYHVGDMTVWIITERDRSVTTALLPEEY